MTVAVLSLGSNMGDSRAFLADAVAGLRPWLREVSSLYRTAPWGPVAQNDFLNLCVIVADDDTDPHQWWTRASALERAADRRRTVRWGPRTLDVDVICVWTGAVAGSAARDGSVQDRRGEPVVSTDPELTLPHPRAADRAFVLVPWLEMDPDATLVGVGKVADVVAGLDTTGIERVGRLGE